MDAYPIGLRKEELDTPTLCLDAEALERNIARMAAFMRSRGVGLRPHSKTHKCPTIAWKQLEAGAVGITCAKVSEAEVMAVGDGANDLGMLSRAGAGPRRTASSAIGSSIFRIGTRTSLRATSMASPTLEHWLRMRSAPPSSAAKQYWQTRRVTS